MDWIQWCGRLSDVERDAAIETSQILVAPSLGGESFGIVLAEAMAHGAAVVASDLPGYRNVATHESDAILVPPGDAAALADALEQLIIDDALRQRVALTGRRRAAELSMDRLSEAYEELYARADRHHRN
jgi:phosphatidylinositol alpha-mannosyltransferase